MLVRVPSHGPAGAGRPGHARSTAMIEGLYVHQMAQQEKVASIGQLGSRRRPRDQQPAGHDHALRGHPDAAVRRQTRRAGPTWPPSSARPNAARPSSAPCWTSRARPGSCPSPPTSTQLRGRRPGGGAPAAGAGPAATASRDVTFETDLDPELPPIQADPSQLRQVLVNLVNNALDAMPDGGTLTVRTRPICTVAGADGPWPPMRCSSRFRTRAGASPPRTSTRSSALLHHQALRHRHGAGPRHFLRHRQDARRADRGAEPAWSRHDLHRHPADVAAGCHRQVPPRHAGVNR